MNTAHLTPQRLRTLQILSAVAAGVCIAVLGDFLVDAFVLVYQPLKLPTWRDYAAVAARILGALLVIAIAYRLVRKATLPGIATIAVLMALLWANLLLSR